MKNEIIDPILVTGASGFVGANLVRRLVEKKRKVYLILRKDSKVWRLEDILPQVKIFFSTLANRKMLFRLIEKIRPKTIFHLAAYGTYPSQIEAERIMDINFKRTMNLVHACAEVGFEAFIHTGSSSEYGFKNKPMKETDLLEPNSYYAVSKAAAALFCQYTAWAKKLPIVILRLFSVYGPYEEPMRLVPTLITSLFKNFCPPLVSPETARDYTFVDDVVDAYLLAAQNLQLSGEIFNIGSGKQTTLKEIVDMVCKITGVSIEPKWNTMPARIWDQTTWQADNLKAQKMLGWQVKNDLESGLRKTVAWFNENRHLYPQ